MSKTETRAGLTLNPLECVCLGAEVLGLVLSEMSNVQRDAIRDLYLERHTLLFYLWPVFLERAKLHTRASVFGENEYGPGKINGTGNKTVLGEEHLTV